jgi:hypothetical protein
MFFRFPNLKITQEIRPLVNGGAGSEKEALLGDLVGAIVYSETVNICKKQIPSSICHTKS